MRENDTSSAQIQQRLGELRVLPSVVVFDLDDTLWKGEVDCTGGPPFSRKGVSRHTTFCRRQQCVKLFPDVPHIFDSLADSGIPVGYASRTWEPKWAVDALKQFSCGFANTTDMWSISTAQGWGDCPKVSHMKEVSNTLGVPYESMVFFDNEMRNIRDVKPLGTTCGYCPDGLTSEIFIQTLSAYSEANSR